jgi:ring-1,2-phenylacetyl-CoA epoxidase subunit PaaD
MAVGGVHVGRAPGGRCRVVAPNVAVMPLESAIWAALHDVHDPEIPTISVVDLGVVRSVQVEEGSVRVELLPTFVGCPAIDMMRTSVEDRLRDFADDVSVEVSFAEPWTTERITAEGRVALGAAGFAPPTPVPDGGRALSVLPVLPIAQCPYCGSRDTTLENAFGPTQCRAIYYCTTCRQPFEQFKEV